MANKPTTNSRENGAVLVLIAGLLVMLLVVSGLTIDLGRAYLVKAQLVKSVDGAALAAAGALNITSTSAQDAATRIFKTNFPAGYLGTTYVTDPAIDPNFFSKVYEQSTGSHIITVRAQASLPTSFLRLVGYNQMDIGGMGEARRRLVDLSLVIDTSGSLASRWRHVRDAARRFIGSFDSTWDRISVTLFSNGAEVGYPMQSTRGFDKSSATSAVPYSISTSGLTSMAEGFYRGWDELRSVPTGSQSGLRVIVLFTDGCANGVPGYYEYRGTLRTTATGYHANEFPKHYPDPDGMTHNDPSLFGLFYTECSSSYNAPACGRAFYSSISDRVYPWYSTHVNTYVPWLPAASAHPHGRSPGIPTTFPLQTSALTVNTVPQSTARGLRNMDPTSGKYPADVWNTNNAARNLVEIIANAARSEYPAVGDYPIRVYTIGMGTLLTYLLGTIPERADDMLKRIANDATSLDYNSTQLPGKYYYAETENDVDPAFQALRSEILRLSK